MGGHYGTMALGIAPLLQLCSCLLPVRASNSYKTHWPLASLLLQLRSSGASLTAPSRYKLEAGVSFPQASQASHILGLSEGHLGGDPSRVFNILLCSIQCSYVHVRFLRYPNLERTTLISLNFIPPQTTMRAIQAGKQVAPGSMLPAMSSVAEDKTQRPIQERLSGDGRPSHKSQ